MKSKMLIILGTMALALNPMALDRNALWTLTAANSGSKACCDHAKTAHGRPARCAKDAACCRQDAKCCQAAAAVTSKDDKPANACPIMEKEKGKGYCSGSAVATGSSSSRPTRGKGTDCRSNAGQCCSGSAPSAANEMNCLQPSVASTSKRNRSHHRGRLEFGPHLLG